MCDLLSCLYLLHLLGATQNFQSPFNASVNIWTYLDLAKKIYEAQFENWFRQHNIIFYWDIFSFRVFELYCVIVTRRHGNQIHSTLTKKCWSHIIVLLSYPGKHQTFYTTCWECNRTSIEWLIKNAVHNLHYYTLFCYLNLKKIFPLQGHYTNVWNEWTSCFLRHFVSKSKVTSPL